jgi:hypothetical protein
VTDHRLTASSASKHFPLSQILAGSSPCVTLFEQLQRFEDERNLEAMIEEAENATKS